MLKYVSEDFFDSLLNEGVEEKALMSKTQSMNESFEKFFINLKEVKEFTLNNCPKCSSILYDFEQKVKNYLNKN